MLRRTISCPIAYSQRDIADRDLVRDIGGICILKMSADVSRHERDVADSHHLFEIGGICIFDMAKDASQHERDVADSHHLFEIGGICIFDMSKDASQHERHITHSDLILDIAGICIFDIQADASQYERDIADSHHFFKIGGICIFDMSADASRHERDIAHHDLILDIAGICIFDMPADVSQHERDHMLNIAGICIFDMSTDDSQHERDVADSDHLFKIGGICIFYMSDASHHERDVADSDHLFKIGSIYIFDMSADASQDERDVEYIDHLFKIGSICIFDMSADASERERDASDDISISPVDMSRPANEPEIVSEARESVSIPPVASNAASSSALAIQLPSDVKSQPRLSSLIASGLLAVLGGLTIGYALNATGGAIGRKPVLIVGSILHLVGSILMYWFPNDVVASIGLTIIGCSVALLNLVIPIILSEINIGKALKWISFVFNSMVLWGSTSAKAVSMAAYHNFRNGWRWSFASSGFFALPLLLLSFLLSETPRFLIKKRRMEEAKKSIKALRKSGAEAELQMLADLIDNEGRGRRKKLSRSPLLLINIATQIFQHVLGLDSILFFGPFILESAGYSDNSSFVAPLIAGVIRAGVAGLAFPSYSYFGRRRTLVSACLGMVVAHISLLGFFLLVGDPIFPLSQKSAYVGMVFAIPLICFYLIFSGPCEWTEESYSEDIRVLGSCWEMNISLVMSLIMNLAVLLLLCTLKAWIFMLFSALTLGVCFSIYKLLPERKRKKTK